MHGIHFRLSLIVLGLACPSTTDTLVIRKRSINSDELISDRQLLHAIDVIERAKLQRRPVEVLSNEQLLDELPSNDDVVDDFLQASYEQRRGDDKLDLDLNNDRPGIDLGDDNDEESNDLSLNPREEKRAVDKDELESIFKQTAPSSGETKTVVSKIETIELVPSSEKEKMFQEEVATIINRVNEEAHSTLAPARNIVEIEKIVRTETKPESGKTVVKTETTDWELNPKGKLDLDNRDDENSLSSEVAAANKEWLLNLVDEENDFDEGNRWRTKKSKRFDQSSDKEEQREKIRNTAVKLLKAYMEEQEEEKRHLSRALNLATMSQIERTDRYVPGEIDEIKQAVKDEQLIQALRSVITNNEVKGENGENNILDESDERADEKRSGYYESASEWQPEDDRSSSRSNHGQENENERIVDDLVKDKLKQYVLQNSRNEAIADNDDDGDDVFDTSLSNRELVEKSDRKFIL